MYCSTMEGVNLILKLIWVNKGNPVVEIVLNNVTRSKSIIPRVVESTPGPRLLKKGTFDTNATINSEGSGDMSSAQYNQI